MLDLAINILRDREWNSQGRCHDCAGLNPKMHELAKIHELDRLGHRPNCRTGFLLKEYERMKDFL